MSNKKPVTKETNEEPKEPARKLASIQVITAIHPIEGADRIEVAQVLEWECVVAKKDGFKVGDQVIYFERDSILPQRPEFEFMRERKFRVKAIKLRKQVSEGLIMPLSILPVDLLKEVQSSTSPFSSMRHKYEDYDVTQVLGVVKFDLQAKEEQDLVVKKHSALMQFLMGIAPFRWVYMRLFGKIKGNWPDWIGKTDEKQIQTCARKLMEHYNEEWYITEKLDGQSATFFTYLKKVWGFWKRDFGVCSRNIWLKKPGKNNYWEVVDHLNMKEKLMEWTRGTFIVQGEIVGPTIQGNKYKYAYRELYVFNMFEDGKIKTLVQMEAFCNMWGFKMVPVLNSSFIPSRDIGEGKETSEVVKYMITLSQGDSTLLKRMREGIVVRLKSNPNISFKVINPYFKVEEDKQDE